MQRDRVRVAGLDGRVERGVVPPPDRVEPIRHVV